MSKEERSNSNNSNTNTEERPLHFHVRWAALTLKHGITDISKGCEFVKDQPVYIKRWLIDGKGTPYAKTHISDVGYALDALYQQGFNSEDVLERVVTDDESRVLLLEYCWNIS